jgi:hypothetical protein
LGRFFQSTSSLSLSLMLRRGLRGRIISTSCIPRIDQIWNALSNIPITFASIFSEGSCIIARDARMDRICRCLDRNKSARGFAEASGAICGGQLCGACVCDSNAVAAGSCVQFAARVSGLDGRAAQESDPEDDPANWLDGWRVFTVPQVHAGADRAYRRRRRGR